MLEGGFIKMYRSILTWEWYDDVNTKTVFLHLLLTVNYEEKKWHGMTIERGQRKISIAELAKETKLTPMKVRTALKHLKTTQEITTEKKLGSLVITVENYEKFQDATHACPKEKRTGTKAQSPEYPVENNNERTQKKQKNKEKEKNVSQTIQEYTADVPLRRALDEFREMRRTIGAPLTERAMELLLKRLDKLGGTAEDRTRILNQSILHGWKGIYASKGEEDETDARKTDQDTGKPRLGTIV